jgi:hypothetical protein
LNRNITTKLLITNQCNTIFIIFHAIDFYKKLSRKIIIIIILLCLINYYYFIDNGNTAYNIGNLGTHRSLDRNRKRRQLRDVCAPYAYGYLLPRSRNARNSRELMLYLFGSQTGFRAKIGALVEWG